MEKQNVSVEFIETHAHIYAQEFEEDLEATVLRAKQAGISRIYMPNIDQHSIDRMFAVAEAYPGYCIPTMGLHPCYVKENYQEELAIVKGWLDKMDFPAIGEIGIDLYWDKTFFKEQVKALEQQAEWAKEREIPVMIHARDSVNEILDVLEPLQNGALAGVFHCYSGDLDQAKRVLDLGFMIGVGGVSTFKNGGLDKVLPHVPIEQMILETDCPYLAPTPHRGKRNEPAYIPLIANKLAAFKTMTVSEVAKVTSDNANRLFQYV